MPASVRLFRHRCSAARRRRLLFEPLEQRSLLAAIITVNSALDTNARDTALTLREALSILDGSLPLTSLTSSELGLVVGTPSTTDANQIGFNIPGSGLHTINLTTGLPTINHPVIIDGYTQPGAVPNSDPNGFNGTLQVELKAPFGGSGYLLRIDGSNNTIRGLVLNGAGFGAAISIVNGSNNVIQGNFLGTDATGKTAAPNRWGIDLIPTSGAGNLIGGSQAAARNIISGNDWAGIRINASSGSIQNTIVRGNFIGTDAAGKAAIGNGIGIAIFVNAIGTIIGGPGKGDGNLISGNLADGVEVGGTEFSCGGTAEPGASSTGTIVQGNTIGADVTGTQPLANARNGVGVGFQTVSANTIGGAGPGEGNIIAFNGLHGVAIVATGAQVLGNSIFSNAELGIHLGTTGCSPTPNDSHDADTGPNSLQNYPTIGNASVNAGNLTIQYAVSSATTNSAYPLRVEFFKADSDSEEGQTFLGFDTYTSAQAELNRSLTFSPQFPIAPGDKIVATATDSQGNTSEFSPGFTVPGSACSTLVVNTNDSGAGSLRDAITCANTLAGTDTISFNIPGAGVHTISPASALPTITDPVIIDGYSQPGSAQNTIARGPNANAILKIKLDGANAGNVSGLTITAGSSTIRGLAIVNFSAASTVAIDLSGKDGNTVGGNFLGVDTDGLTSGPNAQGVRIASSNNIIGGVTPAAANVIAFNSSSGVLVSTTTAVANSVLGNFTHDNGGLGIDLAPLGLTPNDADDPDAGANNLQNFPLLSAATLSGSTLTVSYSVPTATASATYPLRIEFFLADAAGQEGQSLLGTDTYLSAEAGASKSIPITTASVKAGDKIIATATDAAGNTSEFSLTVTVQGNGCSTLVVNTNDAGAGSLRDAINCSNLISGQQNITFSIPSTGVQTISLKSSLPTITDSVVIDGYTQPGAIPNSDPVSFNGNLLVEVKGPAAGVGYILQLASSFITIRGLVINGAGYGAGISIIGGSNDIIQGNLIGTDPSGKTAVANKWGVDLAPTSFSENIGIGGGTPEARNVISGNDFVGIRINSPTGSVQNTLIAGNFIGTDATGAAALPNGAGIAIYVNATGTIIGGPTPAAANVISGNKSDGIAVGGSQLTCSTTARPGIASTGTVIQGNKIGVDVTGALPLGNGTDGVAVGAQTTSTNTIGGAGPGEGNIIAFNGLNGIGIVNSAAKILSNSIFSNAQIGIHLGSTGCSPTPNDSHDADSGPNNLQNYPDITAITASSTALSIQYAVSSSIANATYPLRVEFFKADGNSQEGQTFLGSDTYATAEAETTKTATFTSAVPISPGDKIVATATDSSGNTSEFSPAFELPGIACSTLVVNTNDSGAGSLRDAITCANVTPGIDTISFNIPGSGVQTIALSSALPAITDPVIIDGYTQPGATANSNAIDDANPAHRGMNGTLLIQLTESASATAPMSGLMINGNGSTVRGLVVNHFSNSGIVINGGDNNVVAGNYIGVDATGTAPAGNGKWGVLISNGAGGNRIGANGDDNNDPAERNVIAASSFGGIGIVGVGSDNNVVAGNLIGTSAAGTAALGNANRGVDIYGGAQFNRIGANSDGVADGAERNIISGNGWAGVGIYNDGTSQNLVAGNWIGVDVTGSAALGNVKGGVNIFGGATFNTIGGLSLFGGNVIAHNALAGVTVVDPLTLNNAILENSIYANAGLGIDLGPTGASADDPDDSDSGPNDLQNFPVIVHAARTGAQLKVTYQVPSNPANSAYPLLVEFFKADADGQEGQTLLHLDVYSPDDFAAGKRTIVFSPLFPMKMFDKIVATATELENGQLGSTSEFSAGAVVSSPWKNPDNPFDIDGDTHVAATDAAALVNYLNAFGSGPVPDDAVSVEPYYDCNGDGFVAPNDVLDVINTINAGLGGEGENGAPLTVAGDLLALLAADGATQSSRRKR